MYAIHGKYIEREIVKNVIGQMCGNLHNIRYIRFDMLLSDNICYCQKEPI